MQSRYRTHHSINKNMSFPICFKSFIMYMCFDIKHLLYENFIRRLENYQKNTRPNDSFCDKHEKILD